jgi:hypothetical protein
MLRDRSSIFADKRRCYIAPRSTTREGRIEKERLMRKGRVFRHRDLTNQFAEAKFVDLT